MTTKTKREAVKWARKRLPQLEKEFGIRRSAINTLIVEAERKFNLGLARHIEKIRKIERNPWTEEELQKWEEGEIE